MNNFVLKFCFEGRFLRKKRLYFYQKLKEVHKLVECYGTL